MAEEKELSLKETIDNIFDCLQRAKERLKELGDIDSSILTDDMILIDDMDKSIDDCFSLYEHVNSAMVFATYAGMKTIEMSNNGQDDPFGFGSDGFDMRKKYWEWALETGNGIWKEEEHYETLEEIFEEKVKDLLNSVKTKKEVQSDNHNVTTSSLLTDTINDTKTKKNANKEVLSMPVDVLGLSVRAREVLKHNGVLTIEDLLNTPLDTIKNFRNIGNRAFEEVEFAVNKLKNEQATKKNTLIGIEVGVLLSPADEEFDFYNRNNKELPYGFYDEDRFLSRENAVLKEIAYVKDYVEKGVDGTYGIISKQGSLKNPELYLSLLEDSTGFEFDYDYFKDKEQIVYSVCKKNGELIENFLESELEAI